MLFENMAKSKHFGTRAKNEKMIHEEIESGLIGCDVWCHSVQNLTSFILSFKILLK
jgi:hypothetical protein